jgi:DNA-directed RNA polymerase subunit RPC12/RpoP
MYGMYFQECESIAGKQPNARPLIERLDEFLSKLGLRALLRPELIAHQLDIQQHTVNLFIKALIAEGLLREEEYYVCPDCENLIDEEEYSEMSLSERQLRCPTCDHRIPSLCGKRPIFRLTYICQRPVDEYGNGSESEAFDESATSSGRSNDRRDNNGQRAIIVKGDLVMSDKVENTYSVSGGNVGAMGDGAQASNFTQISHDALTGIDLNQLADELATIINAKASDAVAEGKIKALLSAQQAEEAARKGDKNALLAHLAEAGQWILDKATDLGIALTAEVIKKHLGM